LIDLEAAFVHLARLALTGSRRDDLVALVRRSLHELAKKRPDLKGQALNVLALAAEAVPTRMNGVRPVPVDTDSRLELLRIDHISEIAPTPVWPAYVKSVLDAVVTERQRQAELDSLGLVPTRSLLFVGPPGVGKTLAARWFAFMLKRPLLTLDLAAVMSSFLGRTGNNIRVVLDYARQAPSILLLDEFDAIAKRRDDATEIGELKRLVTVLLQEVDEWPSDGLLIAATNHPELLDPAVWRRFDQVVEFPLPTRGNVHDVLKQLVNPDLGDRSLDAFSALLDGQSFSDISRSISRARRRAFLEAHTLERALGQVLAQLCRTKPLSDRLDFARYLDDADYSQREISELTGLSRDTLRKNEIASRRDQEENIHAAKQ
jgi:SpoVK/Ycf46/Vps4 family AAA+-type ATPase